MLLSGIFLLIIGGLLILKVAQQEQNICRSKVKLLHTSGSVSHASARHKLGVKLGCPPRRDEVFIKTRTTKRGVPLRQAAATIGELEAAADAHPELKDRSIQQGDLFANVCGAKEPKGRVRGFGLGPTPQEIGTPGLKSYVPTRIQMEVLARKKAEQHILELEQQLLEERMERERINVQSNSHHGSNSRNQVSPRSEEVEDPCIIGQDEEDVAAENEENEDYDHYDDENLLDQRIAAPQVATTMNIRTTPSVDDAPHYAHDALVGKDVVLYAILRSEQLVAKGTIVSTNPNNMVGGQTLGKQYCEVVVNLVMKRDAILPRPYDYMESMAGACMMSIAWPYKRIKVIDRISIPCQGAAAKGHARPC